MPGFAFALFEVAEIAPCLPELRVKLLLFERLIDINYFSTLGSPD